MEDVNRGTSMCLLQTSITPSTARFVVTPRRFHITRKALKLGKRQVSKRGFHSSPKDCETKAVLRGHFKRTGTPKRKFDSEGDAYRFLVATNQTKAMHCYHCSFCDAWHLASS